MFQEPKKYIENGHFFFTADQDLEKVCNAHRDKEGVFKVLELRNGKINLVYIGYSSSDGLFNEIVNGLHFDKNIRYTGWTYQMLKDKTDAMDVYWYIINDKDEQKKRTSCNAKRFYSPNWEIAEMEQIENNQQI